MKHLTYILSCIMMAILATACSDDDLYKELEAHKKGIVVKLTSGDMDTKAHLYSQSNWHHVEKVYAILYYCGSDLNATTDPAQTRVVHSELLKKQGKIWVPNKDNTQLRDTFHLALPETYAHLLPGKYMVLCVGIDDESGKTYNLGYDNDTETSKPEFARKDATLDKAIAVLKTPATADAIPEAYTGDNKANVADPTANKEDGDLIKYGHPGMAHSEFFAGWTEFTFKPGDLNMVEVELRRRVAGVLCYLSDIPYKLNNGNTTFRVTKVRLNLNGSQNTQIGLMRKLDNGKPATDDFGSEAKASKVLCEFDLMPFGSIEKKKLLYEIPTAHLQGRKQKENTILMGAYMLPMAEIATGADLKTLSIELLGKEFSDNEAGDIQPNSNEVSITSFPVLFNRDGQDKHSFPIRPNMIYHIGQKLDDNNTEGDYPESLAGTKVSVKEEPWSKANINMEFPSVPINPVMRIICSRGEYKVQPKSASDPYYIFDCMGTDTNYLVVSPSILYENWRVKVISESQGDDRMILFKDPNNPDDQTKWTDSYTGKGTMYIPIVMTDYTKLNGKDTRSEKILITSLVEKDGQLVEEATSTSSLMVEQYNALIMEIDGGKEGYRGFSHFNFGTIRNLVTGEITNYGEKIQWGYFSTEVITPYRYYGNQNYLEFIDWRFIGNFEHSAMQVCSMGKNGQKVKVDYDKVTSEDPFWYLPADWELEAFMKHYSQNYKDEVHNITRNEYYWTCNQTGLHWCAFSQRVKTGNKFEWDRANKNNWFYARQACIVN